MSQKNRAQLKQKFETGDIPTQQDFGDLIDSCYNIVQDNITGPQGPQGMMGIPGPQGSQGNNGSNGVDGVNSARWESGGGVPSLEVFAALPGKFVFNELRPYYINTYQIQFNFTNSLGNDMSSWFSKISDFITAGNPIILQLRDIYSPEKFGIYYITGYTVYTDISNGNSVTLDLNPTNVTGNGLINSTNNLSVSWTVIGGARGPQGLSGSSGTSGSSGSSGSTGTSGSSGSTGTSGSSGSTGTSGSSGTSGTSGSSGSTGTSGTAGSSGLSGDAGTSGSSGTAGLAGTAGTSGVSSTGALQAYEIELQFSGGAVSGVNYVTGPDGSNIQGASGWSFTTTSTSLTINHPLGKKIINPASHGQNGSNILTRAFSGTTTSNHSCFQNSSFTQVNFYSLTAINTGCAGSGTTSLWITFQVKN